MSARPRKHQPKWSGSIGVLAGALVSVSAFAIDIDAPRRAGLERMVLQDCGSCHGMRLTGGLGPALTPAALAERDRDGLVATILHGRRGTAMPPWAPFVTEAEASWVVDRLLEGAIRVR